MGGTFTTQETNSYASVEEIENLVRRFTSPTPGPFNPRTCVGKVFSRPGQWFGKTTILRPVAFASEIVAFATLGVAMATGRREPIIWITPDKQLVIRSRRGYTVTDVSRLSDDALSSLQLGLTHDFRALEVAHQRAIDDTLGKATPLRHTMTLS